MKVLVNGGLNLSVLDGWWAEAYTPDVGWAVGDGKEHGDDPAYDRADAEALYAVLENQIIPEFYNRDEKGIPRAWVARIRESMARLTPEFSANRTVRQYTEEHYLSAAAAYACRAADKGRAGADLLKWKTEIARHWDSIRFGSLKVDAQDGEMIFEVDVYLGRLDPNTVRVELYADAQDGGPLAIQDMDRKERSGVSGAYVYSTRTPATRPAGDFTPRLKPYHPLALPTEVDRMLWQR